MSCYTIQIVLQLTKLISNLSNPHTKELGLAKAKADVLWLIIISIYETIERLINNIGPVNFILQKTHMICHLNDYHHNISLFKTLLSKRIGLEVHS